MMSDQLLPPDSRLTTTNSDAPPFNPSHMMLPFGLQTLPSTYQSFNGQPFLPPSANCLGYPPNHTNNSSVKQQLASTAALPPTIGLGPVRSESKVLDLRYQQSQFLSSPGVPTQNASKFVIQPPHSPAPTSLSYMVVTSSTHLGGVDHPVAHLSPPPPPCTPSHLHPLSFFGRSSICSPSGIP